MEPISDCDPAHVGQAQVAEAVTASCAKVARLMFTDSAALKEPWLLPGVNCPKILRHGSALYPQHHTSPSDADVHCKPAVCDWKQH